MELTPQALHDVEFREARRGGYNTRDVDDFLERVAVGIGQLQDRLRESYHRAEAAEGRLAEMQRQLDEARRSPSDGGGGDADETLRRTLVLAQRTADATIKEAKDEANRLLAEARDEVAKARATAESEAHRDARAELEHLHASRDTLLGDIENLEHHVDEQRERLRDSLNELQRLLDDPSILQTDPAPEVSEVAPPAPAPKAPQPAPAPSSPLPQRIEVPAPTPPPAAASAPAASSGVPSSANGGYPGSPFAGVDFNKPPERNGGLAAAKPSEPASFDPPSFDPPKFETPSFDPPSFDPPSFDSPSFDAPPFGATPPPAAPAAPAAPPAPAQNDGSMVGALQELHNSPPLPSREPLTAREAPREPLPSREALPPARETPREALPAREPLPGRNQPPPTEPIAVPGPGQPGSTGFLPDLNAVFNPPPSPDAPPEDLPPIDAPPPPPPGFEQTVPPVDPANSRPSEWGRGVFDANEEEFTSGEHPQGNARFGGPFRG